MSDRPQQYDSPIGPQRLTPFARLMQFVGLLTAEATFTKPEHRKASLETRRRRKRERQNRRHGRLMAQRGRR
jgi:hypothetical protein